MSVHSSADPSVGPFAGVSISPWVIFIGLGIAAVSLLDFDIFLPVFVVWCLVGILLANKAEDNATWAANPDESRDDRRIPLH